MTKRIRYASFIVVAPLTSAIRGRGGESTRMGGIISVAATAPAPIAVEFFDDRLVVALVVLFLLFVVIFLVVVLVVVVVSSSTTIFIVVFA